MRTRLSICIKKARYPSRHDALAFAERIGLPLKPYRCDRCGQFHLTSRTKGKWAPRGESRIALARSDSRHGRSDIRSDMIQVGETVPEDR